MDTSPQHASASSKTSISAIHNPPVTRSGLPHPTRHSGGALSQDPVPPPVPSPAAKRRRGSDGEPRSTDPSIAPDFIFSTQEEKDRPRRAHLRETAASASDVDAKQLAKGHDDLDSARGPTATYRVLANNRKPSSVAVRRAAAQNVMLVHGCPIWVYSDLLARFELLRDAVSSSGNSSITSPGGEMAALDLNAKLLDIAPNAIDAIDDTLEDCRLTCPHIPLLRRLIVYQERKYNIGRLLLIAMMLYVASSGAEPNQASALNVSKALLSDVKRFIKRHALQCALFSPVKSRELAIAVELLAIYDPLLGQTFLGPTESPSFILPTSFYLETAIGTIVRSSIETSVEQLQEWYLKESADESNARLPVPERIVESLLDASLWTSLEVNSAELNRNLQGITNCFAKDWKFLWRAREKRSSFTNVALYCLRRMGHSITPSLSVGAKLGIINLALRQAGLILLQEVLAVLYDGVPDVRKIDEHYVFLDEALGQKFEELAQTSRETIEADNLQHAKSKDAAASTRRRLHEASQKSLDRELAWMRHFYGGYCFAILLWLPKARRGSATRASAAKSEHGDRVATSQRARARGGEPNSTEEGSSSVAIGTDEDGSATPAGGNSPRFHEHGVHDSDMAKSVIDALKDKNANPDTMLSGKDIRSSTGDMSPFEFLAKHTPGHEAGVQRFMRLTLDAIALSRPSDVKRVVTNSRLIYACKEIIENHATRKRGWGRIGDEAAAHVKLLRLVSNNFKAKANVLDKGLAKLVRVLEGILDAWRRPRALATTNPSATSVNTPVDTKRSVTGGRTTAVPVSDVRGPGTARAGYDEAEKVDTKIRTPHLPQPQLPVAQHRQSLSSGNSTGYTGLVRGMNPPQNPGAVVPLPPNMSQSYPQVPSYPYQQNQQGSRQYGRYETQYGPNAQNYLPSASSPSSSWQQPLRGPQQQSPARSSYLAMPADTGPSVAPGGPYNTQPYSQAQSYQVHPQPSHQQQHQLLPSDTADQIQYTSSADGGHAGSSISVAMGPLNVPPPPPINLSDLDLFASHEDDDFSPANSNQHTPGVIGASGSSGTGADGGQWVDSLYGVDLENLWRSFGAPSSLMMDASADFGHSDMVVSSNDSVAGLDPSNVAGLGPSSSLADQRGMSHNDARGSGKGINFLESNAAGQAGNYPPADIRSDYETDGRWGKDVHGTQTESSPQYDIDGNFGGLDSDLDFMSALFQRTT